jgi:hypothetical protein
MAVNCSPFGPKPAFFLSDGLPAVGNQLFFYVGGSVNTKQNTYTDSTGGSANPNPIVLNSLGQPTNEIWFTAGQLYKVVYAPANDTDPPSSPIWTIDNLAGINDTTTSIDQWVAGPAPTFVSGTSFTLVGDQTSEFHIGRRIKSTNTSGTVYSTISNSVFGAVTTVTVVNDSTTLDSGLSAVFYGLLTAVNPSIPEIITGSGGVTVTYSGGKPTISASYTASAGNIYGCTLSNNAGDATNDIDIATGICIDSTNVSLITVAALTKRLDAGWAAGTNQGMRNSAAAITNATYHIYAVATAAGVQDIYAHTSTTVATVITALQAEAGGASYIYARRIGSIVRAGATILAFTQDGDYFGLTVPVRDVNTTNPGTSAVTATLASLPTGINIRALINAVVASPSVSSRVYISDLATTDAAPSVSAAPGYTFVVSATFGEGGALVQVRTNTSAQVRYRLSGSDGSTVVILVSVGYFDTRGK